MHTTPRQRATPPALRPPGLLGTYPVPELHLVGAPIPGNPRSPIQWQPTPPPLQYGIDYTFMHRVGREPVRWPHSSAITVRITGPGTPDRRAALACVVAELRALTQLNLVTSEPAPASLVPSAVPDGEIHVRYLGGSKLARLPTRHGDPAGLGGASRCPAGCCYVSGFAIINADLAGSDATTEHALAILRHELAHALGLGHAGRPSLLMHYRVSARTTRYGRGDQHGLALLGPRPPADPPAAAGRPGQTPSCAVRRPSRSTLGAHMARRPTPRLDELGKVENLEGGDRGLCHVPSVSKLSQNFWCSEQVFRRVLRRGTAVTGPAWAPSHNRPFVRTAGATRQSPASPARPTGSPSGSSAAFPGPGVCS